MIKHAVLYKQDLPRPYTVKMINLRFLKEFKKSQHGKKEVPFYELHGKTFKEMERYIMSPDRDEGIEKINENLPSGKDIYSQSAYYLRAFSRSQIFEDANHRTGLFCLRQVVKIRGYELKASVEDVQQLGDYLKSHFYIHQGEIMVNLKEKDDVYDVIYDWIKPRLDLR